MAKKKNSAVDDELIDTGLRRRKKKKTAPKNDSVSRAERVRVDIDGGSHPVNGYYIAVAERYRAARYIAFIILVIFLLTMLIFYRDSITYSNLMYLVRDMDSGTGITVGSYANISYDEQYKRSFSDFRGRIASVSSTSFNLYGSAGSVDISDEISYADPRIDTGEKYAMIYDAGSTSYNLYTGVACVLSANAESSIEDGCVSDSGNYALMTKSEDSKFLITVYDAGFRPVTKYYKDKYVVDIALNKSGNELAAVSAAVTSSDIACEIMLGKVGSEESSALTLPSQMPLFCRYASDDTLILLCDGLVAAIRDGEVVWQKEITSQTPSSFNLCENTFVLVTSKNAIGSENEIFVFDTDGNILYNNIINKKISYTAADGGEYVYTVGDGEACMIDISSGEILTEPVDNRVIGIVAMPGNLIVCMPDGTNSLFGGE